LIADILEPIKSTENLKSAYEFITSRVT